VAFVHRWTKWHADKTQSEKDSNISRFYGGNGNWNDIYFYWTHRVGKHDFFIVSCVYYNDILKSPQPRFTQVQVDKKSTEVDLKTLSYTVNFRFIFQFYWSRAQPCRPCGRCRIIWHRFLPRRSNYGTSSLRGFIQDNTRHNMQWRNYLLCRPATQGAGDQATQTRCLKYFFFIAKQRPLFNFLFFGGTPHSTLLMAPAYLTEMI